MANATAASLAAEPSRQLGRRRHERRRHQARHHRPVGRRHRTRPQPAWIGLFGSTVALIAGGLLLGLGLRRRREPAVSAAPPAVSRPGHLGTGRAGWPFWPRDERSSVNGMALPLRRMVVPLIALLAVKVLGWRSMTHWGATAAEIDAVLPGDELVEGMDLTTTRAITVHARAADVWPWIAQLGQGRGGFYSYDAAENLVGCDIHSAELIVPEWQDVTVGSEVRLAPEMALTVAMVDPGHALVLRGGVPLGRSPAPFDSTWAFVLREQPDGTTRLISRERYGYLTWWAALMVGPTSLVSLVMSRKMLHGIADRAERAARGAA